MFLFRVGITILMMSILCSSAVSAETFTECFKETCVMITIPDDVRPDEDFVLKVEGYIENASAFDTTAYMLLENADWNYDTVHMVDTSVIPLDAKGFNWGGTFGKEYTFNRPAGSYVFSFIFGPRGRQHGYYDVAVEAMVDTATAHTNVAFDIKPQSCPNPLNAVKKGVLSAAIVGSSDFNVMQVDPATIEIAGIKPIHFSYEDVTEPYYPLTGKTSELDCTNAGQDGFADLTLKFRAQDVFKAVQDLQNHQLSNGETVVVTMSAELKDGITSITGEDVIRIHKK